MGSEQILSKIRSSAKGGVIGGLILGLMPLIISILIIATGNFEGNLILIIIFAVMALGGFFLAAYNMRIMSDPTKSSALKKYPEMLKLADELCANTLYKDNVVMFSERVIANAIDIRQISFTDEVFLIYVYIHKTKGVTDSKLLKLETARNTIGLPVFRMKDPEINNLINLVLSRCKYARVGYNNDSFAYLKQMKELWKQDQARKKMYIN